MPIKATRALLNAALDGSLNDAEFRKDPEFRLRSAGRRAGRRQRDPRSARAPGRTRTSTTAPRPSWSTCSSTISRSSRTTSTKGVRQAAPQVRRRRVIARSYDRAPIQGPDPMTDFSPRLFADRCRDPPSRRRAACVHPAARRLDARGASRRHDLSADASGPTSTSMRRSAGIISRFNESVGGVNGDTEGYHETITRSFPRTAFACSSRMPIRRDRCTNWSTSCWSRRWAAATGRCASTARAAVLGRSAPRLSSRRTCAFTGDCANECGSVQLGDLR